MVSSRFKGINRHGNGWQARIRIDGKQVSLGTFGWEIDAAICYNVHAGYYFGEFARLNRIPDGEYPHD